MVVDPDVLRLVTEMDEKIANDKSLPWLVRHWARHFLKEDYGRRS